MNDNEEIKEKYMENIKDLEIGVNINKVNYFVNKTYLNELSEYKVFDLPREYQEEKTIESIRLFKINKIIYDKNEDFLDKLSNVYSAVSNVNGSIIFLIQSDGIKNNIYLGVRRNDLKSDVNLAREVIEKTFQGNFPGSELQNLRNKEIENLLENIAGYEQGNKVDRVISSVSSIPSLKSDNKEGFVQGLEKLIDSMRGQSFSAVFISDPISNDVLEDIKHGYENIYSEIKPFASICLNYSQNESEGITNTLTEGMSDSINESISETQSYTKSNMKNKSQNKGNAFNAGINTGINFKTGINFGIGGGGSKYKGSTEGQSFGESKTNGNSSTKGTSETRTHQESEAKTFTTTKGTGFQINVENKGVINILDQIEKHIDRINECKNFGMWNCAAYFIAKDSQTAKIASSNFKSLISGKLSYIENSSINTWGIDNNYSLEISKYLQKLHHPMIDVGGGQNYDKNNNSQCVTPGVLLSGKELPIQLSLPKKSVSGLVVINMAEFGRNVITYDKLSNETIKLGKIFHMGKKEDVDVNIDLNSLGMHTFITGSTGSGKSNTIYKLLYEVNKKQINFLVIEPSKGEYKEIFGGREDVNVFGTNPKFAPMLKINPFSFHEDIHILEHIDRLIEIFNACWPMYAAMPAVLKEAIELAYEKCGWDLDYSICISNSKKFPTFSDLLYSLNVVIKKSAYSEDVKSDYTGALCTRVNSLSNGLLGKIFDFDDIDDRVLFDENTIIDLSRIGSTETKALIMGILFIKLQEYRMVNKVESNSKLKHITVMEEAHNLLRKTSTMQSNESSNLQGKSVEMISNSIAEMRTYGEGFIIADQAPNLLDNSVIRNTNTKIIFRLPDQDDRENVGKAASLNEDQINEIPKLKTGVAVVYQNNWMEPVLCKVDKFTDKKSFIYDFKLDESFEKDRKIRGDLIKILLNKRVTKESRTNIESIDIEYMTPWISKQNISQENKNIIISKLNTFKVEKYIDLWEQDKFNELCDIVALFIDKDKMFMYADINNFDDFTQLCIEYIRKYINLDKNIELEKSLVQCLLSKKAKNRELDKEYYFRWVENNRVKG